MQSIFRFWCLVVSVFLMIGNIFGVIFYLDRKKKRGSSPQDQAVFVPVGAAFIGILLVTRYLPDTMNYSRGKYLFAHTVVFAVSFIAQFMILRMRGESPSREQHIFEDRSGGDKAGCLGSGSLELFADLEENAAALTKEYGDHAHLAGSFEEAESLYLVFSGTLYKKV